MLNFHYFNMITTTNDTNSISSNQKNNENFIKNENLLEFFLVMTKVILLHFHYILIVNQ